MKRKQKMKLQNFKILTLAVVFFSSISLDVYADEEALSKRDLVEIENRIENMNAYELNERREALMEEANKIYQTTTERLTKFKSLK